MELCELLKKTKILLIDDDQYIRSSLEYYFKKKTLAFVTLESAEEALELIKHEAFDVIICDYKLPRMNGLDFFFHLYELQPEALRISSPHTQMTRWRSGPGASASMISLRSLSQQKILKSRCRGCLN